MEPSNGFRSSPVSPSRRQSWSRPSPLPEDTIPHESMNHGSYYEHRVDANEQQQQQRVLSQASELDSPVYAPDELDDRVHLTSQNTVWKRSAPYERDLERRRKSGRAVDRNAGGQYSSGALKAMSKSIKRASIRVVNFASADMDDRPVRLDDVDDHERPVEPPLTTLRGKTLGIFGPMNPLRLTMHKLLTSTYVRSRRIYTASNNPQFHRSHHPSFNYSQCCNSHHPICTSCIPRHPGRRRLLSHLGGLCPLWSFCHLHPRSTLKDRRIGPLG